MTPRQNKREVRVRAEAVAKAEAAAALVRGERIDWYKIVAPLYLYKTGAEDIDEAISELRASTGWSVKVARTWLETTAAKL